MSEQISEKTARWLDAEAHPLQVHGSNGKPERGADGKFSGKPVSGDKSGKVDEQWSIRLPIGLARALKECDPTTGYPYWRKHFKNRDSMISELLRDWFYTMIKKERGP